MYEWIEHAFEIIVRYGIVLMEFIGVALILVSAARAVIKLFNRRREHLSLELARSLALALEFLLCGEIMHTVVVRDIEELIVIGAIVLMRIVLTVLIHWEAKNEKSELAESENGGHDY